MIISLCRKCNYFLFLTRTGYHSGGYLLDRITLIHFYKKHMNMCFPNTSLTWDNFSERVKEFKIN